MCLSLDVIRAWHPVPPGALEKRGCQLGLQGPVSGCALPSPRDLLDRCHRTLPFGDGHEWPTDAQLGRHAADAVPTADPAVCDIGRALMVSTLAVQGTPVRVHAAYRTATGQQARVRRGHPGRKAVRRPGRDRTPRPCMGSHIVVTRQLSEGRLAGSCRRRSAVPAADVRDHVGGRSALAGPHGGRRGQPGRGVDSIWGLIALALWAPCHPRGRRRHVTLCPPTPCSQSH